MRTIPTIFQFDRETKCVIDKQNKNTQWVFEGKGQATRQYDGLCILVEHGKVYRRWVWRGGNNAGLVPVGFRRLANVDQRRPYLPIPGWAPVSENFLNAPKNNEEQALVLAWTNYILVKANEYQSHVKESTKKDWEPPTKSPNFNPPDGIYELCGPLIRGNNEKLDKHLLIPIGQDVVKKVPRTYKGLQKFMETFDGEGIIWHYRTDGGTLMARIKRSDFGFHSRIAKGENDGTIPRGSNIPEQVVGNDTERISEDNPIDNTVERSTDTIVNATTPDA